MRLSELKTKEGKLGLPKLRRVDFWGDDFRDYINKGANEAINQIGSRELKVDVEKLGSHISKVQWDNWHKQRGRKSSQEMDLVIAKSVAAHLSEFLYVEDDK